MTDYIFNKEQVNPRSDQFDFKIFLSYSSLLAVVCAYEPISKEGIDLKISKITPENTELMLRTHMESGHIWFVDGKYITTPQGSLLAYRMAGWKGKLLITRTRKTRDKVVKGYEDERAATS